MCCTPLPIHQPVILPVPLAPRLTVTRVQRDTISLAPIWVARSRRLFSSLNKSVKIPSIHSVLMFVYDFLYITSISLSLRLLSQHHLKGSSSVSEEFWVTAFQRVVSLSQWFLDTFSMGFPGLVMSGMVLTLGHLRSITRIFAIYLINIRLSQNYSLYFNNIPN